MDIKTNELSKPIYVEITVPAEEVKERKKEVYKRIKREIHVDGFRKGNVPQRIAEQHFNINDLYRPLLDDVYNNAKKEKKIVSYRDLKVFGDFKKETDLKMEFIAEIEPEIKLPDFDKLDIPYISDVDATDEEVEAALNQDLKMAERTEDVTDRDILEKLDVAVIDFEGTIEGEEKPFPGGTAKDYNLTVDPENRSFIDNFEEQIIGMRIGETRKIGVNFPEDYANENLKGKHAIFSVILNRIKRKIEAQLTNEFAKEKGYDSIDDYRKATRNRISESNKKTNDDNFKRNIIKTIIDNITMGPIPLDMIDSELERQWMSFLSRINKTEEEYIKENPNGKEIFKDKMEENAIEIIRTMLVLKAIRVEKEITCSEDDVKEYVKNISRFVLKYDNEKTNKALEQLKDPRQYEIQETATLNEKVLDFIVDFFKNKVK